MGGCRADSRGHWQSNTPWSFKARTWYGSPGRLRCYRSSFEGSLTLPVPPRVSKATMRSRRENGRAITFRSLAVPSLPVADLLGGVANLPLTTPETAGTVDAVWRTIRLNH